MFFENQTETHVNLFEFSDDTVKCVDAIKKFKELIISNGEFDPGSG